MTTPTATQTMPADEPTMRFPTARMLGAVVLGGAAAVGVMYLAALVPNWRIVFSADVIWGAVVVVAVAAVTTLAMTPWMQRPMSSWMTMWLGGTVMRLLLTPVAGFLLYSAALPDRTAFGLSIGLSYLLTLLAEAGVLAGFVHQKLTAAPEAPGSPRSDQRTG